MRTAPPVSVRCTGGAVWRAVRAGLPVLALVTLVFWMALHRGLAQAQAAAVAAVVLLAAALPAWRFNRTPAVVLAWDGERWTADGEPGRLEVTMDLGAWLLLRLHPGRWIAVAAGEAGPAWHGLRAAAHARQPAPDAATAPPGG
jgi:hypothetical protein